MSKGDEVFEVLAKGLAMKWRKGPPKEPGIYLRNNPAVLAVVRQDVWLVDGELVTQTPDGSTRVSRWPALAEFWWFGPIPRPPEREAEGEVE